MIENLTNHYFYKELINEYKNNTNNIDELIRRYREQDDFADRHKDSIHTILNSNNTTILIMSFIMSILWFFTGYIVATSIYTYYFIIPIPLVLICIMMYNRSKKCLCICSVILVVTVLFSIYYISFTGIILTLFLSLVLQFILVKITTFIMSIDIKILVRSMC